MNNAFTALPVRRAGCRAPPASAVAASSIIGVTVSLRSRLRVLAVDGRVATHATARMRAAPRRQGPRRGPAGGGNVEPVERLPDLAVHVVTAASVDVWPARAAWNALGDRLELRTVIGLTDAIQQG